MRQLGNDIELDMAELDEINLGLPVLKEVGAKWLVKMAEYIAENPQLIVNGFIRSGITGALDGCDDDEHSTHSEDSENDSDDYFTDDSENTDQSEDSVIIIN